jgi:hypothetical protein
VESKNIMLPKLDRDYGTRDELAELLRGRNIVISHLEESIKRLEAENTELKEAIVARERDNARNLRRAESGAAVELRLLDRLAKIREALGDEETHG